MRARRVEHGEPGTLSVVAAIGRVTFLEITRDRVLYNVFLCAVLLFGVGLLASRLMLTRQDRVMQDFGISVLVISSALLAILCGAGLIGREFERRTIYVALSRPISRFQFLLGKYLGLLVVLTVNWLILTAALVFFLWSSFHDSALFMNSAFAWAAAFAVFGSWILGAVSILFSTFSTTSLSVIMTVGCYLLGNNVSQIQLIASHMANPVGRYLLYAVGAALPNLERLNLGTKVAYALPVAPGFGLTGFFYSVVSICVSLALAGALIRWREG